MALRREKLPTVSPACVRVLDAGAAAERDPPSHRQTDRTTADPSDYTMAGVVWVCVCSPRWVFAGYKKPVAVVCALFYKTIRKKEKMQSGVSLAAVSSARARARATKDGLTFEACSLSSLSRARSLRPELELCYKMHYFSPNKIK